MTSLSLQNEINKHLKPANSSVILRTNIKTESSTVEILHLPSI